MDCNDRDYTALTARLGAARLPADRTTAMQLFVDAVWELYAGQGVSWVGFYMPATTTAPTEMVLGPRRDKPACSPIGLHGACGRAFLRGCPLVVRDVKHLGENYVACDPRDQAELVIPLFETSACWGVLDVDSFDVDAFDARDAAEMTRALQHIGLTSGMFEADALEVV